MSISLKEPKGRESVLIGFLSPMSSYLAVKQQRNSNADAAKVSGSRKSTRQQ
jgi:hypothetical protein